MSCHPMFIFVYFSLLLMTAGFVLTLCSWLAPPLNDIVHGVRIFGLVGLLVGSLMLLSSCVVGGLNHGRCFSFCYMFGDNRYRKKHTPSPSSSGYMAGVIENPLVVTANNAKTRTVNHVPRSHRGSGTHCAPLHNHSAQERILRSGEKANYGSCKGNAEAKKVDPVSKRSHMTKAVLVLTNDAALGDNRGNRSRDVWSHDSQVMSDAQSDWTEIRHNSANSSLSSGGDDQNYNTGQIRILKAYHRRSTSDNDISTFSERFGSVGNHGEEETVHEEVVTECNIIREHLSRQAQYSTEDDLVQTFMSG